MDSLEDILSSEMGGPVVSYIVIGAYLDEDGENMLYSNSPDEQPLHVTMGLVEFAKTYLTKKFIEKLDFYD